MNIIKKLFRFLIIVYMSDSFAMELSNVSSGKEEESAQISSVSSFPLDYLPPELRCMVIGFTSDWKLEGHSPEDVIKSYKKFLKLSQINKEFRYELPNIYKNYLLENLPKEDLNKLKDYVRQEISKKSPSNNVYWMIKLLNDLDPKTKGSFALYTIIFSNNLKILKLLIDLGLNLNAPIMLDGKTPLMLAIALDRKKFAKLIISSNPDINIKDHEGNTALMYAIQHGDFELVKLLLDKIMNVETANELGATAVMAASENGRPDLVKLLINAKANINAQDKLGFTALMYAAQNGHADVVNLLIKEGADVNIKDQDGYDALMVAQENENEDIEQLLKSVGEKE